MDIGSIKAQVMEDFYKNSEKRLLEQQEKIKSLENELNVYAAYNTVDKKIIPELKSTLSCSRSYSHGEDCGIAGRLNPNGHIDNSLDEIQ